jgi:predicted dehydrogenase
VQIAILGTGQAARIHSKVLRAVAPSVGRWYASRDETRASAASRQFTGAGHFAGYEAALASPKIDTVLVGLPPSLHLEWALRALDAGKHVIVEKPPFLTETDFSKATDAAARAGRQLIVAENYYYKPLRQLVARLIEAGDLGEVRFIQLTAMKHQPTNDWRDEASVAGGGALYEGGIHWISFLANIGLTPENIRARRVGRQQGPDRNVLVTLDYREGATAALSYSWDLGAAVNGLRSSRIYGTQGTLRFETNGLAAWLTGRRRRLFFPGVRDLVGYRAMWLDFLAAIADNRPPAYGSTLALRDLRLVVAACTDLDTA